MPNIGELECTVVKRILIDDDVDSILLKTKSSNAKELVATCFDGQTEGKRLIVSFKWLNSKRTLNANAYFHVLIDKIAEKMGIGREECKVGLVKDYGTLLAEIALSKNVPPHLISPYYTLVYEGMTADTYQFYKQTSTLDKTEMKRLVNGTVQEAKELGIETKTPQELALLYSLMEREA